MQRESDFPESCQSCATERPASRCASDARPYPTAQRLRNRSVRRTRQGISTSTRPPSNESYPDTHRASGRDAARDSLSPQGPRTTPPTRRRRRHSRPLDDHRFAPSTSIAHASAASGVSVLVCRRRGARAARHRAWHRTRSHRSGFVPATTARRRRAGSCPRRRRSAPSPDGDLARHALVDGAMEARRVDRVATLRAQPVEHRHEPPAVEGLDRTLAVVQSEPVERRVGQVEPVHRQVDGDARTAAIELLDERDRQGRLAAAGTAGDAEHHPGGRLRGDGGSRTCPRQHSAAASAWSPAVPAPADAAAAEQPLDPPGQLTDRAGAPQHGPRSPTHPPPADRPPAVSGSTSQAARVPPGTP